MRSLGDLMAGVPSDAPPSKMSCRLPRRGGSSKAFTAFHGTYLDPKIMQHKGLVGSFSEGTFYGSGSC